MRVPPSWRIKALGTVLLISALAADGRPNSPQLRTKDVAPTQSLSDTPVNFSKPSKLLRRSSFGVLAALKTSALQSKSVVAFPTRKVSAAELSFETQQTVVSVRALTSVPANHTSNDLTDLPPASADIPVGDMKETAPSPPTVAPASTPGTSLSDLNAAAFSSLQNTWHAADALQLSVSQRRDTQDALATMHLWAREIAGERLDKALAGKEDLAMLVADGLRRIELLLRSEMEPSWDKEEEENDPYEAVYYEATRLLRLMPIIEQRLAFLEGEDAFE